MCRNYAGLSDSCGIPCDAADLVLACRMCRARREASRETFRCPKTLASTLSAENHMQ